MRIAAGLYKNRQLKVPKGQVVRPTSARLRQALFNICQSDIEDAVFLDLFAGSGAMGLEALSRGAKQAIFVDSHKESIHCIRQNIESLNLQAKTQVWQGDVFSYLERFAQKKVQFNIIYADPPYEAMLVHEGQKISYSHRTLQMIDQNDLLLPNGQLFIEDVLDPSIEKYPLTSLVLKSSRASGRSALLQYERNAQ